MYVSFQFSLCIWCWYVDYDELPCAVEIFQCVRVRKNITNDKRQYQCTNSNEVLQAPLCRIATIYLRRFNEALSYSIERLKVEWTWDRQHLMIAGMWKFNFLRLYLCQFQEKYAKSWFICFKFFISENDSLIYIWYLFRDCLANAYNSLECKI